MVTIKKKANKRMLDVRVTWPNSGKLDFGCIRVVARLCNVRGCEIRSTVIHGTLT
jgi:hypothetical protein